MIIKNEKLSNFQKNENAKKLINLIKQEATHE